MGCITLLIFLMSVELSMEASSCCGFVAVWGGILMLIGARVNIAEASQTPC